MFGFGRVLAVAGWGAGLAAAAPLSPHVATVPATLTILIMHGVVELAGIGPGGPGVTLLGLCAPGQWGAARTVEAVGAVGPRRAL